MTISKRSEDGAIIRCVWMIRQEQGHFTRTRDDLDIQQLPGYIQLD
jgi:hypothetical protein